MENCTTVGLHIMFAVVLDMTPYAVVYNYRHLEAFATSVFRVCKSSRPILKIDAANSSKFDSYIPLRTASEPRRLEFSSVLLWETQMMQALHGVAR